jgi:NitT/TauT family transport system ATP-binding protein
MTSRPGRIAEEFDIDVPRPRLAGDVEVAHLTEQIIRRLREEVGRHADD